MRIRWIVLVGLAAALALPIGLAAAAPATVLVDYDPALGELPEGLAVDKTGNIFVSLSPLGRIERIGRDGTRSTYSQVAPPGVGLGPLGLAVDAAGAVYAAVSTLDPATRGVYRIERDGSSARLPGTDAIIFPNGLAFDKRGNLYATDTIAGAVWRIPRGGSAELWFSSPLLLGTGEANFGFPIGANGIAYRQGALVVGNSEGARILRIPIDPHGDAGPASVLVEGPAVSFADGMVYDVHGDLWLAVIAQSKIVRISPTGTVTTFATAADGLDWPSQVVFGQSHGEQDTLYAINFAIGPPGGPGPRLMTFDPGVRGQPLP